MKILIAAGGTGGHIYPGIAIAEEMASRDPQNMILFIGCHEGLEKNLVEKENFEIKLIYARGILRKISFRAISAPFITFFGFFQSLFILFTYKPDFVVLTGGYVSFPVAFAAKLLGIKTLLTEQNVLPGFTNRVLSKFVDIVALSFSGSLKYMKGIVTGNPVRKRIKSIKKTSRGKKTLLVVGGSQGAKSINKAILSNIDLYSGKGVEIFHIIGIRDFETMVQGKDFSGYPFYHPIPYMYNIEETLSAADLVISRAGATAIAEFLVLGIPMVLVPFPYSSEGHQDLNAKLIEQAHAAVVINEKEIGGLPKVVFNLIENGAELKQMSDAALRIAKPDAAKKIVDLIYEKA